MEHEANTTTEEKKDRPLQAELRETKSSTVALTAVLDGPIADLMGSLLLRFGSCSVSPGSVIRSDQRPPREEALWGQISEQPGYWSTRSRLLECLRAQPTAG